MRIRSMSSLHRQPPSFHLPDGWAGQTEWMAEHLGPGIGGLLNATFGNAAELIIAIMALRAGLHDVVKASITGSIIGNILFVLGLAIVVGGAKRSELKFNRTRRIPCDDSSRAKRHRAGGSSPVPPAVGKRGSSGGTNAQSGNFHRAGRHVCSEPGFYVAHPQASLCWSR